MSEKKKKLLLNGLTVIAFLFLLFMMAFRLNHSSLWYDEWVEYYYSQAEIADGGLYHNVISTFQPPLYNVLMHFWLKVNQSITWFRLFNLIPGMISGLALYESAKVLKNQICGIFSVFFLAIAYQWIYMIQECSEYAVMLMFVFLTVYAYIKAEQKPSLFRTILLALASAGAAYSQYGCVFVVGPLLVLHLIRSIMRKDHRQIRNVLVVYGLSVVFLAVPLYMFFAKIQLGNHEIGAAKEIGESIGLANLLTKTGGLVHYLFVNPTVNESRLTMAVGFIVIAVAILSSLFSKDQCEKDLNIVLLIGLAMHYLLVRKHIYAMVHAGMSAGFYCRYSVFYLAILPLLFAVWLTEMSSFFKKNTEMAQTILCVGLFLCVGLRSVPKIFKNWDKSYDRQMAWTWLEWKGFETTTYLYGTSEYSFDYFVKDQGYDVNNVVNNCWKQIDTDQVPAQFWVWYSNYGLDRSISFTSDFNELNDDLKMRGYCADVISDYGDMGQLILYHMP